MKWIAGGVTAPLGFSAASVYVGIKAGGLPKGGMPKPDMALIYSQQAAAAAGTFTTNLVQAAPVVLTKRRVGRGQARAIICNSGNANACTGDEGLAAGESITRAVAEALKIRDAEVLMASTGVIGVPLPVEHMLPGIPKVVASLSPHGGEDAARAIMTTDTKTKIRAVQFEIDGKVVTIGGIAKGSGMIHPNMATMLGFITTDAEIEPALLQNTLVEVVADTFNMITVDGDTSTNDMVLCLANGASGVVVEKGDRLSAFRTGLLALCKDLARMIAADGEGATRLLEVWVSGARTKTDARLIARAVAASNLVKAAVFGADANWGRILCAAGYSGAEFDPGKTSIYLGNIQVAKAGQGVLFDGDSAKAALQEKEVTIGVRLEEGLAQAVAWGCDLSYDYVRINASYRS